MSWGCSETATRASLHDPLERQGVANTGTEGRGLKWSSRTRTALTPSPSPPTEVAHHCRVHPPQSNQQHDLHLPQGQILKSTASRLQSRQCKVPVRRSKCRLQTSLLQGAQRDHSATTATRPHQEAPSPRDSTSWSAAQNAPPPHPAILIRCSSSLREEGGKRGRAHPRSARENNRITHQQATGNHKRYRTMSIPCHSALRQT